MSPSRDIVVVGGGAAGLSASLVLGRARKDTLLIDAGRQVNLPAEGIGGLLGHDGVAPSEFYATGREELARYPSIEVRDAEATAAERDSEGFRLELSDGSTESARQLLLAGGIEYGYPDLPGAAERWGRSVFHCPFCHGWEARDRVLGVLDAGGDADRALLLRGWSDHVTLYTNGPAELDPARARRLEEAGIPVDERRIGALIGRGDALSAISFEDGGERACEALLVCAEMAQTSSVARQLGVATYDDVVSNAIKIDETFKTSVDGVYAAGDATGRSPSVASSVAAGSSAAALMVQELI